MSIKNYSIDCAALHYALNKFISKTLENATKKPPTYLRKELDVIKDQIEYLENKGFTESDLAKATENYEGKNYINMSKIEELTFNQKILLIELKNKLKRSIHYVK